jgi:hypothetical protein
VIDYELLRAEARRHAYPLLLATISGAHLYGFPSPDSDYDLRGVHILPASEAVGLLPKRETVEFSGLRGIHLMRTGTIQANLPTLNEEFRLPFIPDLIERKTSGPEKGRLESGEVECH